MAAPVVVFPLFVHPNQSLPSIVVPSRVGHDIFHSTGWGEGLGDHSLSKAVTTYSLARQARVS